MCALVGRPWKAAGFDWSRRPVFQPTLATFLLGDLRRALDRWVSRNIPLRPASTGMETFEIALPLWALA